MVMAYNTKQAKFHVHVILRPHNETKLIVDASEFSIGTTLQQEKDGG